MRFIGTVEVVLKYNIDAVDKVDAETKMRSAINRIKNLGLTGIPDIKEWSVKEDDDEVQETES
jgi:hypothetical protein